MNFYNMVCGINPWWDKYLSAIKLEINDIPRFRDAFLFKESDQVFLYVYTRSGGNNREEYEYDIKNIQNHPNYVKDFDDDFDSTYATFVFTYPFEYKQEETFYRVGELTMTS